MTTDIITHPHQGCARFFGYGRGSTEKQVLTLPDQEDLLQKWFSAQPQLHTDFDSEWAGWYPEPAQSTCVDFIDRPVGQLVFHRMRRGDVLLAAKFDRLFRSDADYVRTRDALIGKGCAYHVLDMPFHDLRTANGRLLSGIMAVVKQYDRDSKNERTRESAAFRKANGLPYGKPPIGWQIRDIEGLGCIYHVDSYARKVGDFIVDMYEKQGFGFYRIAKYLRKRKIKNPNADRRDKRFSKTSVYRWYTAAKAGYPLPGDVPPCTEAMLRRLKARGVK